MEISSEQFYSILKGEEFDIESLNRVLNENPWFSLVASILIRDLKSVGDDITAAKLRNIYALSFSANPYNGVISMLRPKINENLCEDSESIDVINSFLDKKVERIKSPPKMVVNAVSDAPEADIYTEQFAEILVSQGFIERAKQIYRHLSLVNPEKSAYFVGRISELD